MQRYLIILLFGLCSFTGYSQKKAKPVNFSLWHPVATIGYDSLYNTKFTFGLGQSKVHNLSGFGLNLIGGLVTGNVSGATVSGVASYTKGNVKGLTAGGLLNVISGNTKGLEVSTFLNINLGTMEGLQFATLSNMSIGRMRGWQLSTGYNVVSNEMQGVQLSALGNITTKGSNIVQLSGIFNMSLESMKGIQLAVGNFADTIKGMQLGLLNISSIIKKGVQIGLINYSHEETGLQIGLINVSRSSRLDFMVYTGNFLYANFAARIQNKHSYSIIGIGIPYHDTDEEFSGGLFYRFGVKVPVKKFSIRPDIGVYILNIFDEDDYQDEPMKKYSLQGRLSLEYILRNRVSIFVTGGWSFTSEFGEMTYTGKPVFETGLSLFLTTFIRKK
ncbi:MAG: hypothetical protein LBL90_01880 [Prevotellaceae bacterium]|jgi:hypothetical protein|nr:hypothetical protein [Prevotellaceae bacterium]